MTYTMLLKKLLRLTPAQLRQKVKLKEGCSGNVTEVYVFNIAKKDEYHEELVENEGGKEAADGTKHHWESTGDLLFKKGQVWMQHDH